MHPPSCRAQNESTMKRKVQNTRPRLDTERSKNYALRYTSPKDYFVIPRAGGVNTAKTARVGTVARTVPDVKREEWFSDGKWSGGKARNATICGCCAVPVQRLIAAGSVPAFGPTHTGVACTKRRASESSRARNTLRYLRERLSNLDRIARYIFARASLSSVLLSLAMPRW